MPPWPLSAFQCLRLTISARLSVPATARRITSPPLPPSPPSGPPRGTYFSRRKLQQPRPPSPPLTKMVTRSTNMRLRSLLRSTQPFQFLGRDWTRPSRSQATQFKSSQGQTLESHDLVTEFG